MPLNSCFALPLAFVKGMASMPLSSCFALWLAFAERTYHNMMSPRSGPQQNHARHGFACYKSRKESAARFQGLPGRPAAKRHFRAIITEMRIFQRAFAKKILAAPPNFCPLSRAKLCKYTNFVGFAPAETFCVAPRGCNARGAAAPQRRFVCCPCGVFREGAAKGFEEAVCFF